MSHKTYVSFQILWLPIPIEILELILCLQKQLIKCPCLLSCFKHTDHLELIWVNFIEHGIEDLLIARENSFFFSHIFNISFHFGFSFCINLGFGIHMVTTNLQAFSSTDLMKSTHPKFLIDIV